MYDSRFGTEISLWKGWICFGCKQCIKSKKQVINRYSVKSSRLLKNKLLKIYLACVNKDNGLTGVSHMEMQYI